VAGRRARWDRLEQLLAVLDRRGVGGLSREETEELALGYRAATSDLAIAQSRGYDAMVLSYVNRLATRAHAYVYAGTSASGWSRIVQFASVTFPREVRRSWAPILVCTLITVISAIIAYHAVATNPANAYALLSDQEVPHITKSLHDSNFGFDRSLSPLMSPLIITNNIKVCTYAFAGGATLGIFTLWIILENGLMVGGLGALFAHAGFGRDFWATIAPHGVIELSAIQIAGGAGLLIAAGVIAPGRARRVDAIVRNARRAGNLIMGVAGMLVVAGTIEGFVTPQRISENARFGIGAATALALIAYLGFAGRAAPLQERARLDLDVGVEQRDAQLRRGHVDHADSAFA
jgi:uncharacterized membrane protein SpoIIM required for sporulation